MENASIQYIKDWVQTVSNIFKGEDKDTNGVDVRNYFMKKSQNRVGNFEIMDKLFKQKMLMLKGVGLVI